MCTYNSSASTRLLAAIWWFFTLIMVSSYTAQLASFLTIENPVKPFENIAELAKQNVIKYGAKTRGSTVNFFRVGSLCIFSVVCFKVVYTRSFWISCSARCSDSGAGEEL